jgi:protein-tyrosine phosphatase
MYAGVFWIEKAFPGKLGIMQRPAGHGFLPAEIKELRRIEVHTLVSVLEASENKKLGLEHEGQLSKEAGITFYQFPIPDRSIPEDFSKGLSMVKTIADELRAGKNVLIHCRKSIGRSPMLAAAVMVYMGESTRRSFQMIKKVRKAPVPDKLVQYEWVQKIESMVRPEEPQNQYLSVRKFWQQMLGGSSF